MKKIDACLFLGDFSLRLPDAMNLKQIIVLRKCSFTSRIVPIETLRKDTTLVVLQLIFFSNFEKDKYLMLLSLAWL